MSERSDALLLKLGEIADKRGFDVSKELDMFKTALAYQAIADAGCSNICGSCPTKECHGRYVE